MNHMWFCPECDKETSHKSVDWADTECQPCERKGEEMRISKEELKRFHKGLYGVYKVLMCLAGLGFLVWVNHWWERG